ncbi:hypothetical protein BD626DRAFT_564921 [Schizophyllum amplum]|uniref:WIBG Mago-binding domain-containing protein n=1 Tax=Schizophyllum amplum TaxID=97359 RepID=A0A550CTD2_9AGAR|nr:hypothetical protein BD626DRAFT_564921 [Auriculariopsis ampla]
MSRPPIKPDKTTAGIAVDPYTQRRVIPESRRPDGTVRKEIKIRPGFTPQEDVKRFRGTRQAQMDSNQLPKGHIVGWVAPSIAAPKKPGASGAAASGADKPLSKSAKKNAKRKEKREETHSQKIKDNWEDEDEDDDAGGKESKGGSTTSTSDKTPDAADMLAEEMDKLNVKK